MVSMHYRVIYGDTDQMGVVYYGNYLRYFEAGRNEYLREKGARYRDIERELEIHLPVVEASVRYRHPAKYDDLLRIETEVTEVRRASLRFAYRIVREEDERLLAEGETIHACVDLEHRPVKLPGRLVELLG